MIEPTTIDELQEHLGEVGAGRRHPVTQDDSFEHFSCAMNASLDSVAARPDGADVATTQTFERAGGDRPVCVARRLTRVRS